MKEFIKALRENKAYGYIANNGHNMSKEDLINIIKEYEYAIQSHEEKEVHNRIAISLEEMLDVYED